MEQIVEKTITAIFFVAIMAWGAMKFALYMVMSFLHPVVTSLLNLASGFSMLGSIMVLIIAPSGAENKTMIFWMMLGTSFACFALRFAYNWVLLTISPLDEYILH